MTRRHCLDCGTLTSSTRCPPCHRAWDQRRQAARGNRYGADHQAARTALRNAIDAGGINCHRCSQPIHPDAPFDADHIPGGWAPSHPRCNRAAGGRNNRRTP